MKTRTSEVGSRRDSGTGHRDVCRMGDAGTTPEGRYVPAGVNSSTTQSSPPAGRQRSITDGRLPRHPQHDGVHCRRGTARAPPAGSVIMANKRRPFPAPAATPLPSATSPTQTSPFLRLPSARGTAEGLVQLNRVLCAERDCELAGLRPAVDALPLMLRRGTHRKPDAYYAASRALSSGFSHQLYHGA